MTRAQFAYAVAPWLPWLWAALIGGIVAVAHWTGRRER